jgi:hypothetical protein
LGSWIWPPDPELPLQKEVVGSHPACPKAGSAGSAKAAKALARKTVTAFFLLRRIAEIHLAWSFRNERSQELSLARVNLQEKCVKR